MTARPITGDEGNGIKKANKFLDFSSKLFQLLVILVVLIGLVVTYRISAFDEKCIEPLRQDQRTLRKDFDIHVSEACVIKKDLDKKIDTVEFKAEIDKMHIKLENVEKTMSEIKEELKRIKR
jgi:hypothetical protein